MVNTKLDIHICGPINGLPFWPTSLNGLMEHPKISHVIKWMMTDDDWWLGLSIFWEAIQQLFEVPSGCDSRLLSSVLGNGNMGYGSIPIDTFLVGWTSIYQLFWGSLGTRVLTHPHMGYERIESSAILSYEDFCIGRIGWDLWDKKIGEKTSIFRPRGKQRGTLKIGDFKLTCFNSNGDLIANS